MEEIRVQISKNRDTYKLTRKEISDYLGLGKDGQKIVKEWEEGAFEVPYEYHEKIENLSEGKPYYQPEDQEYKFKFIDLFAGVGGIRLGFQKNNGKCVFTSEWDKFAQKTYHANFGEWPDGDITKIPSSSIPDHDILLGGFPCQAFSQAGLKKGFSDPRGTLFFDVQRILVEKRPKAFLLENVKQLKGHDKGRTLKTILNVLQGNNELSKEDLKELRESLSDDAFKALSEKLNYHVFYKVLNANEYGVPQNRERVYIVGFDKNQAPEGFDFEAHFSYPEPVKVKPKVGDILFDNKNVHEKYTLSEKLWSGHLRRKEEHKKKGNGFGFCLFNKESSYTNTISARYYKDGSEVLVDQSDLNKIPRKLTPRECARLQGFPEDFIVPVSDMQAYKQFGNSVATPVIEKIAANMVKTLEKAKMI
ncbi:DNA cytosine methyltransferase [Halobacteriovorax sp. RT-2-4]|uniref:DNA cytosine methyltransferase n=1 Tax=unclassified Halobacteriovorax TaxID=2639665 RepID=UPI00399B8FAE